MKLSKYEQEREANIARNKALLAQLDLKQAVDDLTGSLPAPKPKDLSKKPKQSKEPRQKRVASDNSAPRRQSSRLAEANAPPTAKRKREFEEFERQAKEAEERLEREANEHISKRPRHDDLDLASLLPIGDNELPSFLRPSADSTSEDASGSDGHGIHHADPAYAKDVEQLRNRLQDTQLVAQNRMGTERIYSAVYHADVSKELVIFGDKSGKLGIWDVRASKDKGSDDDDDDDHEADEGDGKVYPLQLHWPPTHHSSISSIKIDPHDPNTLFTSSYDSSVRETSLATQKSQEVYNSDGVLISCVDMVLPKELWISDNLGGATHLDLRQPKGKYARFEMEKKSNKIGSISINPTLPHLIAVASNSRTMRIWDTRCLSEAVTTLSSSSSDEPDVITTDELDEFMESPRGTNALRALWSHGKAVTGGFWAPDGQKIVSSCYDNLLRVWDFRRGVLNEDKPLPSSRPATTISHRCETGRFTTLLRARWSPNPDVLPHFSIGCMSPRYLSIYSATGDVLAQLEDDRITAVQAVTCLHPKIVERAASGNSSGKIFLWGPSDFS